MSGLDQPLLIASGSYHVRHEMSVRIPEEQGFFREEGLTAYEYDWRGLIPGPLEREGLAMIMKQHGVDVATAVGVEAALYQRCIGSDVYVVGAWRYMPRFRLYAGAAAATPDLSSYERVTRMDVRAVARELEALLGAKVVAYIAGVTEAHAVRQWSRGDREPRPGVSERLRTALGAALMIASTDGSGVAQAWFQGLNPQLDDRSPAHLLREGSLDEMGPVVLGAARAFVAGV